jgi:hypothetical protein
MRGDLRTRSSPGEQRIELIDGAVDIARLAGARDLVQAAAMSAQQRQIGGLGGHAVKCVPVRERLHRCQVRQQLAGAGPARVDQLGAPGHGFQLVSIKMTLTAVSVAV